jgi:hypothetical protein
MPAAIGRSGDAPWRLQTAGAQTEHLAAKLAWRSSDRQKTTDKAAKWKKTRENGEKAKKPRCWKYAIIGVVSNKYENGVNRAAEPA